jgi:hypothetical protein
VFGGVWAIEVEKQNQQQKPKRKHPVDAIPVGARLPAIYRAAVAKSGDSAVPDTPHVSDLLPVPGRSRASALLQLETAGGQLMPGSQCDER